jgi:hypothetical protein
MTEWLEGDVKMPSQNAIIICAMFVATFFAYPYIEAAAINNAQEYRSQARVNKWQCMSKAKNMGFNFEYQKAICK